MFNIFSLNTALSWQILNVHISTVSLFCLDRSLIQKLTILVCDVRMVSIAFLYYSFVMIVGHVHLCNVHIFIGYGRWIICSTREMLLSGQGIDCRKGCQNNRKQNRDI